MINLINSSLSKIKTSNHHLKHLYISPVVVITTADVFSLTQYECYRNTIKTTVQISKSPNNKNKHHKWMNKSTLPALPAVERVSVFPQDPLQVPLGAGCFKGRGARPCAAVPGPGACSVLHGSGAVRLSAPLLLPPAGAPSGTLLHAEAGSGRVKAHRTEM